MFSPIQYIVFCFVIDHCAFAMQNLLSLIRSHLFIFAFIYFALGVRSKKNTTIYVKKCSTYVLFYEFYSFMSYI